MSRFRLLLPVSLMVLSLVACGDQDEGPASASESPTQAAESSADAGGECEYVETGFGAKEVDLPPSAPDPADSLTIATDRGDITVELSGETPCTSGSFTSLAEQGYFDDTPCHRLTTEGIFVLQCGDPTGSGSGGPGYSFADELTGAETYPAGTVAMANAGPDTNGSQFFLVYEDTQLPPAYTVFGSIDEDGLSVVRGIAEEGTDSGAGDGAPASEVLIESVS